MIDSNQHPGETRYAVYVANFGALADPVGLVELAVEAERSGWDGFFLWDHLIASVDPPVPVLDPWIVLAAVAARTQRLVIGPLVTPLARRRPWKLARETVSLNQLSGGRLVLGIGLGAPSAEYSAFGEDDTPLVVSAKLDEALELLQAFWSGEPVEHDGPVGRISAPAFLPAAVGDASIPVWAASRWPSEARRPRRRAARCDGLFPIGSPFSWSQPLPPDQLRAAYDAANAARDPSLPRLALIHCGWSTGEPAQDEGILAPYDQCGIDWWLETFAPDRGGLETARRRVAAGPPRRVA